MDENKLTKEIIRAAESSDEAYFEYAAVVASRLPKKLHEQLRQLINGPVWDGDVICKSDMGELLYFGLAQRICCKGEQGYTGATYFAHTVMKIVDDVESGRRGL